MQCIFLWLLYSHVSLVMVWCSDIYLVRKFESHFESWYVFISVFAANHSNARPSGCVMITDVGLCML